KSYCKRCGEWLSDLSVRSRISFGGQTPQQNIFTGLFMNIFSAVAALVSAIVLYATYWGQGAAKWSVYFAAALCLCVAGSQASSFMVGLKLRQRLKQGREGYAANDELISQFETRALDAGDMTAFADAHSVTEGTTRILKPRGRSERDPQR